MTDSDFEKITPAELEISARRPVPEALGQPAPLAAGSAALGGAEALRLEALQRRNHRILWAIFAVLLALAAAVLFVLPRYVAPPAPPAVTLEAPPARPSGPAVSPYEEAQRLQQREAAQGVLASLLELQDGLEARNVSTWASTDFERAVAQAVAGDEAYRMQDFILARARYAESLALLQDIDARSGEILAGHLAAGQQALEAGDAEAAEAAFLLATAVEADNAEAAQGLSRAAVLEDLLALLEAGEASTRAGELEAAREHYRQASALDPAHNGAAQALARAEQALVDRDFGARMSRGYAALQAGEPAQAEAQFQQALAIKPGANDAQAALEQASASLTSNTLSRQLGSAAQHERDEAWQEALDAYEQALATDPNLVAGLEGRERSSRRLNLDRFLEAALADPLRLADESVHRQTREVLGAARALPSPGPRLSGQIRQVEDYLSKALVPVNVALHSDGLTRVTVYRVGELGTFSSQVLSLTPGTYTAVGIREGYRDVRQEFTVAFDGEPPVVTIACDEQIL